MNKRLPPPPSGACYRKNPQGSAIVAVLGAAAFLSVLLVLMLQGIRLERKNSSADASDVQARMAVDSGVSAAMARLLICTSNNPSFLVGLHQEDQDGSEVTPALVIGATNLRTATQLMPLFSCSMKGLSDYPELGAEYLRDQLSKRVSQNPNEAVDLNDPKFMEPDGCGTKTTESGGLISAKGSYPALWISLRDGSNNAVARYAFILTDESARLNPSIHLGEERNDPNDWDKGPGSLSMTNSAGTLFSAETAAKLRENSTLPTEGSLERAFDDHDEYARKHDLLTLDPCLLPDLIPPGYPEAGLPKYNLNDLATNPAWGATPYARATNIASIIDRNLPSYKFRDPSLPRQQSALYLVRLACSIVDYISPNTSPTGPSAEEPLGRDLVPYVTQIAERCTRRNLTSNSVTVESRFFVEIWNPTTSTIPAGGCAGLLITNRAILKFGHAIEEPFADYKKNSRPLPAIRPNEFVVVAFDPEDQTWQSPDSTTNPPLWDAGPQGNADGTTHQAFSFYWNGKLVDLTRRAGISRGDTAGGLVHLKQTLDDTTPKWQCMTVPTRTSSDRGDEDAAETDQAIDPGRYNFVGDPRSTFLTAYKWPVVTDYRDKSFWMGVNPAGSRQGGYLLDPMRTWTRRDRIPLNPATGIQPTSKLMNPDEIPSPYGRDLSGTEAPFVIRKGPMSSIAELGNLFDPAQVADNGEAPDAGYPKKCKYCCGGGRTLRIGQPEFHVNSPEFDWDLPGKRAVNLIDLFTVKDEGRMPGSTNAGTNAGIPGRINVNTASHEVLTSLFTGVTVTSDRRFTNSLISAKAAEELATLLEQHRPYTRLSDLGILTTNLVNSDNYIPRLSANVPGSSPPVADVFDRAREEAFGKIIGHCAVQSRTFRITVVGEALDRSGKTSARSLLQGVIRVSPDSSGTLIPSLHNVCRH